MDNSPPETPTGGMAATASGQSNRLSPSVIHTHRLAERDAEYDSRVEMLRAAAAGVAPRGHGEAPANGAEHFVQSLQGVDVEAVIEAMEAVHRQGYVIVPELLTADTVARLRDGLQPLFEAIERLFATNKSTGDAGRQTLHVQNVLAKTTLADEAAEAPFLRALMAGILGFDYVLNAGAVAMAPDPGCAPQGLHRDDGFYAAIARPHLPLVVTAAIALDDFTPDNGGTQLVPGSVSWPEDRMPNATEVVHARMPSGAVLVWDGGLFHGGGGNRTDQARRTLTLNYARGWLRTQFNQYLCVPRERVLSMSPTLQGDLGYHRSALGLGGCDLQDPLRYLERMTAEGGDGSQTDLGFEAELS